MKTYRLGRWFGLEIAGDASALIGLGALWLGLSLVAGQVLRLPWQTALPLALAAIALHLFSGLVHQLGHAAAARATGFPMTGIRLWAIFGASQYAADEPTLPAAIHIRRALGGPAASALLSLLMGLLTRLPAAASPAWWLAWFVFLDNLLVFTLQAVIPLGFNDGWTLFHWLRMKK
jgi:hypothetical protein